MTDKLVIRAPDDWHLHLRDGAMMKAVLPASAHHFARAIIMPNLVPPIVNTKQALAYRDRILNALPEGQEFDPLMTLYLTEDITPEEIATAAKSGLVKAVKLYPAGATTNSASGVRDFEKTLPVLEAMAKLNMPLCVHGEVSDFEYDIFDREKIFIDKILNPIRSKLPELKIVMEHVTTRDGVDYAAEGGDNLAATITVHHLFINRNHMLAGGIRPHYYCLPVAKREIHRQALIQAAISGSSTYFLGTDSAPHLEQAKLNACGCAGIYTAPHAMNCLAQLFEDENSMEQLEAFTAINGPRFYNLPLNDLTLTLERQETSVQFPQTCETPEGRVILFDPGRPVYWHCSGKQ